MRGDIGAGLAAVRGFANLRIDHQHVHHLRLVQQRHCIAHRAAGFARRFPCNHHALRRQRRGTALGHHQHRSTGVAQDVVKMIVHEHIVDTIPRHRRQHRQIGTAGVHRSGVLRIQRHRLGRTDLQRHVRARKSFAQRIGAFACAPVRFLMQSRIDVVGHCAPIAGHRRRDIHGDQHRHMRLESLGESERHCGRSVLAVFVHIGNQNIFDHGDASSGSAVTAIDARFRMQPLDRRQMQRRFPACLQNRSVRTPPPTQ